MKVTILAGGGNCKPFRSFRDMTMWDGAREASMVSDNSFLVESLFKLTEIYYDMLAQEPVTGTRHYLSISSSGSKSGDEAARCL